MVLSLVWFPLGQPLLTASLSFALLSLLSYTRLFVETSALELTEQALTGQFLLCDFEGFFNVIIKNFDFHPLTFRLSQANLACCLWFLVNLVKRGGV